MADQQIENIVDEIEELVLTDLHIVANHDEDEDGHHAWYDTAMSTRQRAKLVSILERLLR